MSDAIADAELLRFRNAIVRRLGLGFDDGKLGWLADVLHRRTPGDRTPASVDRYLAELELGFARDEWRALASELTVCETYFFRNGEQLEAFADALLGGGRRVRVLSAGCASGEEPYSLAMLARERGAEAHLTAVDLNPAMIERATRGRYSPWSLRETSPERERRWFAREGNLVILDNAIKSAVRFEERNLAQDDFELWRAESFDAIFCRNVIMYFSVEQGRLLVSRMARALKPGGYLFLGHAETLRGLSGDFHLCHTHNTFYYQRRGVGEPVADDLTPLPSSLPAPEIGWATTWIDAVQRSADRIRALADAPPSPPPPPGDGVLPRPDTRASSPKPVTDLSVAFELLRQERYAEALQLTQSLPPEARRDPDALLLRAALLTHCGQFALAAEACTEVLGVDELNAGSHYLLALCSEATGNRAAAMDHDRTASYLDPEFVMPCLHLGLMARRAGDRDTARAQLQKALALLPAEDGSRLLLFGGGFQRAALIALCRAALADVEARS